MQLSNKILNQLSRIYLLTSSTDKQIVTLKFDSQYYNPCYYFLYYQLYNHLKSTKPLLIIDFELNYRQL
ncbi:unnamed protein product [Paramecium sonneborni]|uniref:Uncharacterized protein n=1 Tax=Paramecium sonneborni TaxID=65129 RepID=A0A8S1P148_9CILI|nr:unnamed protein product [Paramecium sonneborni]